MADLPARAARAGARIRIAPPGGVRGHFDLVVADVPCSGSGTWRRTPDAKWRLTPQGFADLLDLQTAILAQAAGFVAAGGALTYMTWSLLEPENGETVRRFLEQAPFSLVEERRFLPPADSDGFYLALIRRD